MTDVPQLAGGDSTAAGGDSTAAGGDDLARRLASARARLAAQDLPPGVRTRLQRQFIAVCDAAKRPDADTAACQRRLDGFLDALESVIANKSGFKN